MNVRILSSFCLLIAAALTFSCSNENYKHVEASPNVELVDTASADPLMQKAQAMIANAPDSPLGYTQLAVLFAKRARETGDFSLNSKAETAVGRALEIAPDDITARKLQASLSLTFHRFSEALDLGTKLKQEFPNDSFVYGVLTDANVELGNYDAAVEAAQMMVDLKPNTASYARAAHMRSLYGEHKGAVEMFKLAARTADPQDKEAQSWCLTQLGDELWKYGKYAESEKVYDEALTILPNYYLATFSKARVRASLGDMETAEKILEESQNRIPSVDGVILLADIYTSLGQSEKASRQMQLVEMVEQKLGLVGDQKRLALFWADRNTNLEKALEISSREYADRKDIFTADVYAWCLLRNGQAKEAKQIISEAMRLNTNDARILYHAGMIESALGNRTEARKLLSQALKTNPTFDLVQSVTAKENPFIAEVK